MPENKADYGGSDRKRREPVRSETLHGVQGVPSSNLGAPTINEISSLRPIQAADSGIKIRHMGTVLGTVRHGSRVAPNAARPCITTAERLTTQHA
jgi:hypothetical protein